MLGEQGAHGCTALVCGGAADGEGCNGGDGVGFQHRRTLIVFVTVAIPIEPIRIVLWTLSV